MQEKMGIYTEELLKVTVRLRDSVMSEQEDPQNWIDLLNAREEIIQSMRSLVNIGESLTERQKEIMSKVHELNQNLIPHMDNKKQQTQQQLNQIQRSKNATNSYYDMGPNGYGAFFDKRK